MIPRIAPNWSLVADYLEYEVEDKKLIREKCHHDPLKCCVELLENWLSTDKGVSPKSWSTSIEVLRQIKSLASMPQKIVQDLAKAGVFVQECILFYNINTSAQTIKHSVIHTCTLKHNILDICYTCTCMQQTVETEVWKKYNGTWKCS